MPNKKLPTAADALALYRQLTPDEQLRFCQALVNDSECPIAQDYARLQADRLQTAEENVVLRQTLQDTEGESHTARRAAVQSKPGPKRDLDVIQRRARFYEEMLAGKSYEEVAINHRVEEDQVKKDVKRHITINGFPPLPPRSLRQRKGTDKSSPKSKGDK